MVFKDLVFLVVALTALTQVDKQSNSFGQRPVIVLLLLLVDMVSEQFLSGKIPLLSF